jgi:hypothetical protein
LPGLNKFRVIASKYFFLDQNHLPCLGEGFGKFPFALEVPSVLCQSVALGQSYSTVCFYGGFVPGDHRSPTDGCQQPQTQYGPMHHKISGGSLSRFNTAITFTHSMTS